MAGTPLYKVFNPAGEYIASCKLPHDAAAIIASYGDGASIRLGHSKKDTVWMEGSENKAAGESYDYVAEIVYVRQSEIVARWKLTLPLL